MEKVWKASPDAQAGIKVDPETAVMAASTPGKPNFVMVNQSGVYVAGPQSWMTMPENIRVGGLWVQNSAFLQMLPSTMAFPIPNLLIAPPVKGIIGAVGAVSMFMNMLV